MKKLVLLVIVWCLVFGSITTAFASDDAEATSGNSIYG